jgi:hypothetical protein
LIPPLSLPGLTRQSIIVKRLGLLMDARVKPAHDESVSAVFGMTVAACCRCSGAISA